LLILLTDFGQRDYYVGAVKGAAYQANPRARIESLTHDIAPFNVREGGVTLALAAREYPPGTVFVAVVDPGVGTQRRAIALRTNAGRIYVAPDNGLLTFVVRKEGIAEVRDISGFRPPGRVPSKTFQGRDLFAPTGALLAGGLPMRRLGPSLDRIQMLHVAGPAFEDGWLKGEVMRIDRFGNVVTNIPKALVGKARLAKGDGLTGKLGGRVVEPTFATTYGDVEEGQTVCLLNGLGYLELAINRGSLAQRFNARVGMTVDLRKK